MNYWTELSVEFAANKNYLDELYRVYPISPNLKRDLDKHTVNAITASYKNGDNLNLIKQLLKMELFPIKDSYVAFLRKDKSSIDRNPNTVDRIAGNLHALGLDEILKKCSDPKESNRQIGPMFSNWLNSGVLGCAIYKDEEVFLNAAENCLFLNSDSKMKDFAMRHLGYTRADKGLDFIAKFNGKYVIAEAKFITAFGGHQNDQFEDAISTITSPIDDNGGKTVIPIAIMDGVLYIKGNHKQFKYLQEHDDLKILSALVLREFLYSI